MGPVYCQEKMKSESQHLPFEYLYYVLNYFSVVSVLSEDMLSEDTVVVVPVLCFIMSPYVCW